MSAGSLSQTCSVYGGAQSGPHSPGYEEAERQAQILAADLELTARQASIAEEERRLQVMNDVIMSIIKMKLYRRPGWSSTDRRCLRRS